MADWCGCAWKTSMLPEDACPRRSESANCILLKNDQKWVQGWQRVGNSSSVASETNADCQNPKAAKWLLPGPITPKASSNVITVKTNASFHRLSQRIYIVSHKNIYKFNPTFNSMTVFTSRWRTEPFITMKDVRNVNASIDVPQWVQFKVYDLFSCMSTVETWTFSSQLCPVMRWCQCHVPYLLL